MKSLPNYPSSGVEGGYRERDHRVQVSEETITTSQSFQKTKKKKIQFHEDRCFKGRPREKAMEMKMKYTGKKKKRGRGRYE